MSDRAYDTAQGTDSAPLTERAGRLEADPAVTHMTPLPEEARRNVFFTVCPAGDQNARGRPSAATGWNVTKQSDAR